MPVTGFSQDGALTRDMEYGGSTPFSTARV